MPVLILDRDFLKMLTNANSITASQSGDKHCLTIYPEAENYDRKYELPLEGFILGKSQIDTSDISGTYSSETLWGGQMDIFKLLTVGDEIKLQWYPDIGRTFHDQFGLVEQRLCLCIWRKKGKKYDILSIQLASRVYKRSDPYSMMCQGFKAKVREPA